ncbi:MAG TPA: hypothetical protein VLW65_02455 [Bryobacteraceae bacterium]|nr:hypothetical protein [Bryobacteraceae bacterium]
MNRNTLPLKNPEHTGVRDTARKAASQGQPDFRRRVDSAGWLPSDGG